MPVIDFGVAGQQAGTEISSVSSALYSLKPQALLASFHQPFDKSVVRFWGFLGFQVFSKKEKALKR
jgi:hypothetical protein